MTVLGISTGHDSGAAVVVDGKIVAAVNEERMNRAKMFWGFPELSIVECLRIAGIEPKAVEFVAVAGTSSTRAKPLEFGYESVGFFRTFFATMSKTPLTGILMGTELGTKTTRKFFQSSIFRGSKALRERLNEMGLTAPLDFVDHHLCHAASAYYTSGWDRCTTLTLDGSGDGYCSRVYDCENQEMKEINSIPAYHSPGFYYCYVTHLLGFTALRHEGKVTGLAAFGDPEKTSEIFSRRIRYADDKFSFVNKGGWLQGEMSVLEKQLKPFSREDIAAGIQKHFEDIIVQYAIQAVKHSKSRKMALAGGVFANVKLNQEMLVRAELEDIYIYPNMGDGGLAAGAALDVGMKKTGNNGDVPGRLNDVYLGSEYSDTQIEQSLGKSDVTYKRYDNVEAEIGRLLADGKIVARFNGRMEYGPRALGNRSILYHVKDRSVNTWLNKQLNRTEFMPFAPVILKEDAGEYLKNFDGSKDYAAQFMTITYDVTPKCADLAPAITHVDGTARPQIITEESNKSYYHILKEYKKLTGLPILVNTSFNMHEEPIVRTPDEAITAFQQSKLDYLAIGNYIVKGSGEK